MREKFFSYFIFKKMWLRQKLHHLLKGRYIPRFLWFGIPANMKRDKSKRACAVRLYVIVIDIQALLRENTHPAQRSLVDQRFGFHHSDLVRANEHLKILIQPHRFQREPQRRKGIADHAHAIAMRGKPVEYGYRLGIDHTALEPEGIQQLIGACRNLLRDSLRA